MDSYIFNTQPPKADVRLPYGPDPLHFGDLRLPSGSSGPHPVVMVVHGGFWRNRYDLEFMGFFCAHLTERGYATWNIEYRRIGDDGGAWPGTFLDVARATNYLRELAPTYNLDLNRTVATGHSAGGHLVCWLAARSRIPANDPLYTANPFPLKAVISLAGVLNLREAWELKLSNLVVQDLMDGSPDQFPERYATASPSELLPTGVPQALIHGTADKIVPYEISKHYYSKAIALGEQAKLVALPGADHFEVIDPKSKEWPIIVAELENGLNSE